MEHGVETSQEEYDKLYPFHYELYIFMVKYPDIYYIGLDKLLASERTGNESSLSDGDREMEF